MKHIRLCAALAAAFLAQETLAQNTATSTSSSSANPTSNASSTGNVQSNQHSSTNNTNSSSTANQNATASSNNSQNNGSASSVNANITVVTPGAAAASNGASADGRLRQSVESSSHTTGEHHQYIDYGGSYTVKNVPNVSAPPLISSNDTCMGSASGGVSVAGFGITGGSTYTDEHCKRIKMSRELWNKGMKAASLALDCMDPDAREALELTGFTCPQTTRAQRAAADQAQRQAVATVPVGLRPAGFQPPMPAEALALQPAQPATPSADVQVTAIPDPAPLQPSTMLSGAPAATVAETPAAEEASVVVRRVDGGEALPASR